MHNASEQTAERILRESYGRLLAMLATRTHEIAAAEDALSEAFAAALESWPRTGVPQLPEAWLVTVSRNRLHDAWRHARVRDAVCDTLQLIADEYIETESGAPFPDERLRLMFVCAHPAIDQQVRPPLMLQAVLGIDVARMAGAFLTSPAALGQRLVRAKHKIRQAGIPFDLPAADDLEPRLADVLDGIYAAYGTGWNDVEGADSKTAGLTAEAIQLGEAVVQLLPKAAEPLGLLALMLFCEARARARRDADGRYVALSLQDTRTWDRSRIAAAEALLLRAAQCASIGPFQLEAAIQSAHCQRYLGAAVAPADLLALYDGLIALRPSVGALVSRACAVDAVSGAAAALVELDAIPPRLARDYQPYWAARAHLLAQVDRTAAMLAYERAIALADSAAVIDFLLARCAELRAGD